MHFSKSYPLLSSSPVRSEVSLNSVLPIAPLKGTYMSWHVFFFCLQLTSANSILLAVVETAAYEVFGDFQTDSSEHHHLEVAAAIADPALLVNMAGHVALLFTVVSDPASDAAFVEAL